MNPAATDANLPARDKGSGGYASRLWQHLRTWPLVLIAGFTAQLALIFFVTALGLGALQATEAKLVDLVDQRMLRLELTKTMQLAARERTLSLARMITLGDPFEFDAELQRFHAQGMDFMDARRRFQALPLTDAERALLEHQWTLIRHAQRFHKQIIDLSAANRTREAQTILVEEAIPAQGLVMEALSQLDDLTRLVANQAVMEASHTHAAARRWMIVLSVLALTLGLAIAGVVVMRIHRASCEREHMATHDHLTGLPNRVLLRDRLDQAILRSRRLGRHVGLLFIDLDGFKEVNDTLGHAVGDELLKHIAAQIKKTVRGGDIVARLGGDEFIIGVLDAANTRQIDLVAEKLLHAISQPMQLDKQEVCLSGSVGICVYPRDGMDADTLLRYADLAMYTAKQAGKNQVRHFAPELCHGLTTRLPATAAA